MKLLDFMESKYVESNLKNQVEFSLALQAKSQAAQNLINAYRSTLRKIAYITLLVQYALVLLKIASPPQGAKEMFTDAQKASSDVTPIK
jgi:hypothetical protein